MASYYAYLFLKEISNRTNTTLEELKYVMPTEIEQLFEKPIDKQLIERRKQNWVIYYLNGKEGMLDAEEATNLHNEMFKQEETVEEIFDPLDNEEPEEDKFDPIDAENQMARNLFQMKTPVILEHRRF